MKKKARSRTPRLRWSVLTLFPETLAGAFSASILGKAAAEGVLDFRLINFREFAAGRHRQVDDQPYGGGAGMVLKVEPLAAALAALRRRHRKVHTVLLTPQGRPFSQADAQRLSRLRHVALVCGRYEGFDERVRQLVDEEISLGDFVLAGGEAAAWAVIEATSRLVPGVLGEPASLESESFSAGLLEYPQYTRPRSFRGLEVPEVLLTGNHARIDRWRRLEAIRRTARRRPELLEKACLSAEERACWEEEKKNIESEKRK